MNECIIGIGSNIDAEENIRKALDILMFDFQGGEVSSMEKTKPVGITRQPYFTNGAIKIKTELSMERLQQYLKRLEDLLGRDRSLPKFGPRTIDLDIVVWNHQIVDPDYYDRGFLRDACKQLGVDD